MKKTSLFLKAKYKKAASILLSAGFLTLSSTTASLADIHYWVEGGNSLWNAAENWSLSPGGSGNAGQPHDRDNAYLLFTDGSDKDITYSNTAYPSAVLDELKVDAANGGYTTLNQGKDNLAADDEYFGVSGYGAFVQTGGTNRITNDLFLGVNAGSTGCYVFDRWIRDEETGALINADTHLSAKNEYIGKTGSGYVAQFSGENRISGLLQLGSDTGSYGRYLLRNGAELSAQRLVVAKNGSGYFEQSDGAISSFSSDVILAWESGSIGIFSLKDGDITTSQEQIGVKGDGRFYQWGGRNNVQSLSVASQKGGIGMYQLRGGELNTNEESIGYVGNGSFQQYGGTNTVLTNLWLGRVSGSKGTYDISGGELTAANEYIGTYGNGFFKQNGGTNTVSSNLILGSSYHDGTGSGRYDLSATGELTAGLELIGYWGNGVFYQDGGRNTASVLRTGGAGNGTGSYTLGNGELIVTSEEYLGSYGFGTFAQTGGKHSTANFWIGDQAGHEGRYSLGGSGELTARNETIGEYGIGIFEQSGGIHTANRLSLAGETSTSKGEYRLSDGLLSTEDEYVGRAGDGKFLQSGGTNSVNGKLHIRVGSGSTGEYIKTGGGLSAGQIVVGTSGLFSQSGGNSVVKNDFSNSGLVKISGSSLSVSGKFINNTGMVINNNSLCRLNDYFGQGFIQAGAGDQVVVSGDFRSFYSGDELARNTWNTVDALLGFVTGGDPNHNLYIAGYDMGATLDGYSKNFSWNTLSIADGNILNLLDANISTPGAALYVREVDGLNFNIDNLIVSNIFASMGLNIYYDPALNPELRGLTFDFLNSEGGKGGQLIAAYDYQAPVPIPAAAWIFLSGLISMAGLKRKKTDRS